MEKPEPTRSCLLALRHLVLNFDSQIQEVWQYKMPFYKLGTKRLCYLWDDKKTGRPYLGIVDGFLLRHPLLVAEKRSRMKILLIDPAKDLPLETIREILEQAAANLRLQ
ncbi:DUF1801 domain-containing protein [Dyadobacter sp. CY261]|uniref:DUF1801 domain-containing protein n=1 Tax=Dyadobacter sp. CY261 TaxID=2907203 RepID=UPI001F37B320|nr:DUF1801 domain-containing protein [Dyadobacter sp. CY261]MCF0070636.1 DUF1801 domain-containing protein [Dyadobacter sp. CY261]